MTETTTDPIAAHDFDIPCGGYFPCHNPATIALHMFCGCIGPVCKPCRDKSRARFDGPYEIKCAQCGKTTIAYTYEDIVNSETAL